MDLQELVQAFNNLPRSPKSRSGLVNNHWQFAVQHVPISPPGDLVHLVNPESRFTYNVGPAQILSCPSVAAQADVVLPLLLKAFIDSMGMKLHDPSASPFAPWSWGTGDEELAKALEERLNSVGVRKELCRIKVGDEEKINIEQEEWTKFLGTLKEMVGPKCNKCRKGPTGGTQKLQLCGRCKKAQYCSIDCQKWDWKDHKIVCKHLAKPTTAGEAGSGSSSSSSVGAMEYYQIIAPNMPKAQALASEIGLKLPCPGSGPQGLG
jgi:MYND finger